MDDSTPPKKKGTGWLATSLSVLAAGFGVQSPEALERDFNKGSAIQFIVAGLIGTAIFIFGVYMLVVWVMSTA